MTELLYTPVTAPFDELTVRQMRTGQMVKISGTLYGARDAAHQKLLRAIELGTELPIPLLGQVLYYVGPAPAKPGQAIGPAGPTTSGRMDPFTIPLLEKGVRGLIGKGYRSERVKEALVRHQAVYLAVIGGAAALISRSILQSRVVAFPELGPEAIFELKVQDFPAVVINDTYGGDAYQGGKERYRRDRDESGAPA